MVLRHEWSTELGFRILVVTIQCERCGATGIIKFSHSSGSWRIFEDVQHTGGPDNLGGRNEYTLEVYCHCRASGERAFSGNAWLSGLNVNN
jgi:hypothetical protein